MTQAQVTIFQDPHRIPTTGPRQDRPSQRLAKVGRLRPPRSSRAGSRRAATRGCGEVIELEHGITVYPARKEHGRASLSGRGWSMT